MRLLVNSGLDQASWDQFILRHPAGHLLQSWAWGDFQQGLNHPIWRLRVIDDSGVPLSQLLVLKLQLGFGKFVFYTPREVLVNSTAPIQHQREAMELTVNKLRELAKDESVILWRTDPPLTNADTTALSLYRTSGFIKSRRSVQPRANWIVSLDAGLENLLTEMKPKTRYNIRLSEKHGVKVVASKDPADIRIFNQLNSETANRDRFTPHSDGYYKKQLEVLGSTGTLELFIAYLGNTPLAAILVAYFGKHAFYLHGASSNQHREVMANHAIQWVAMQAAQSRGCTDYDMGGIDINNEHPSWSGITRFKQGFGGRAVEYVGTLELPLNKIWHRIYKLLRGN